jgi:hypothetical protein
MPCVQRARAEEHARYVAAHRVDVDPFAGLSDPVDILRAVHRGARRPHDPLVNLLPYARSTADVYRSLDQDDADRLLHDVIANDDFLDDVARHLASFASIDLGRCQEALLDRRLLRPSFVFRGAHERIVDRLFALLPGRSASSGAVTMNDVLLALAWTRAPRVIESMIEWSRHRPSWSSDLHIPPHEYTQCAGYILEDTAVRDLVVLPALRMIESDAQSASVSLFEPIDGPACPRCLRSPISLFDVDVVALPVELRADIPSRVPTCLDCSCYGGPAFVQLAADGTWRWLPVAVSAAEHRGEAWELASRTASLKARLAWEAVDWCVADGISQIGGHPSWVQDPRYPACPRCRRTMMTVAQVALEDFDEFGDGVFYVHHCTRCAIVGVSYQQT